MQPFGVGFARRALPAPGTLGKVRGGLTGPTPHLARAPLRLPGVGAISAFLLVLAASMPSPTAAHPLQPVGWSVVVEAVGTASGTPEAATEGTAALIVPLAPERLRFGVLFRHSVEQTPVIEWFEPASDGVGMVLVATEYRSFGAGLPTEPPPGGRFVLLPDRFLIEGLAVPIGELILRTIPLTEHALLVGGQRYDLTPLAGPGHVLRIRVQHGTGPGDHIQEEGRR